MPKARDGRYAWGVAFQWLPAVGATTSLVMETPCAIRTDSTFHTTMSTSLGWREWLGALSAGLDRHITTRVPDLWGLLRIPTEAQDVVPSRDIRDTHLVHYAKVEVLLRILLRRATEPRNAALATATTKAVSNAHATRNGWRKHGARARAMQGPT